MQKNNNMRLQVFRFFISQHARFHIGKHDEKKKKTKKEHALTIVAHNCVTYYT